MRRWSLHLPFGLLLGLVACVAPPPLGVVEGEATAVGGGVAGAEATLVPAGAVATDGSRSVRTDASGAFVFERVPPGEYGLTVIAAADGLGAHVPAVSVARDETTSVPVALTPLGGITAAVDVSDRAVRPDGELVIDAFLVGTPLTARVDAAGSLVLEGVPEGGFELSLRSAGYATVAVPVTVAAGEVLAVPETVVLRRLAPYARFDLVRFGDTVEVDASASFAVDGGGLRYAWEFGDGATASGVTATHTYFRGGSMTIRLTVTDDEGNSDSVTQQIEVTTPRVPAGSSRGAVVAEPTLAPGQMAELEVAPTAGGPLLYLEVPAGGYLEATQGGGTYYASTPDRFSRGSLLDDTTGPAGADLAPQAITTTVRCDGPCVILPAAGGAALVRFVNPSRTTQTVPLVAFMDAFSDANEPNDGFGAPTPLFDEQEGAIELVGDRDVFRVEREGRLVFSNPPTMIRLRAQVYAADGFTRQRTLADGESMLVTAEQYVVVEALADTAAASARSLYFLTLE